MTEGKNDDLPLDLDHKGRAIETGATFEAPADHVYRAWSDPELLAGWFVDRAEGGSEVGDVQTWHFERFGFSMPYEVVIAEPGRRFALRCEIPGKGVGLMEIVLEESGGRTRMRFVNSGFGEGAEWDAEYEGIDSGWNMATALLKEFVDRHWGETRHDFMALRPCAAEADAIVPRMRTAEGLATWLTDSGELGPVGSEARLVLKDGSTWTGEVLCHTGSESTMRVNELNGAVEFKTFPMGPGQRAVALRGSLWGGDKASADAHEGPLGEALDGLVAALG